MRCLAGLLLLLVCLTGAPVEARPVQIEVRAPDGSMLGRLPGDADDRVTYVALADVAKLVRGTLRPRDRGERVALVARGKVVEVRRDSPQALVGGRLVELSAPVRGRPRGRPGPRDPPVPALPAALRT